MWGNAMLRKNISALFAGLVFGIGLILSGMTNPSKVLGFLDIFGNWDPSLMFVMGGGVGVAMVGFHIARKRGTTFFGGVLHWPELNHIDAPLVIGSLLFGAGWGLAGFCPGPALVSMAAGQDKALVFVLAMLAGMALVDAWRRLKRSS